MDEQTGKLAALLHDFGEEWAIDYQRSPAAWVAVRRIPPSEVWQRCAHTLDDLRVKLESTAPHGEDAANGL